MTDFDPEAFEDKYANYFTELQQAYKNAFTRMNDRYDSELIHAIDQFVLNESEPIYDGDGQFHIDLPADPYDRLQGVLVDQEKFDAIMDEYLDELEAEHRAIFGFED